MVRDPSARRCRRLAGALATAALACATPGALGAQDAPCFTFWELLGPSHLDLGRGQQLLGERPLDSESVYRAGLAVARACDPAPAVTFGAAEGQGGMRSLEVRTLPAVFLAQVNSGYPRPGRNGLLWGGRGFASVATAGAHARWGPVSAMLAPVFVAEENRGFAIQPVPTPGLSTYGSYFHAGTIDAPQRFGKGELFWLHPGQSYLRVDAAGVAAGVSTENLRWGPARRNPLLMSGAAPGFPHFFLGTSGPVDAWIGRVEVDAVWGRLSESEFFDDDPDNDDRLLSGLVVAFTPGNTGLTLGAARVYSRYIPPEGLSVVELLLGPYTGIRDNPDGTTAAADNQLLSAFFRWAVPGAGFEAYGEYARDDHWEDFRDLLLEPDHSRAYGIGLQQVFRLEDDVRRVRVAAEATNLNSSATWMSGRPAVDFYTHSGVRQGHTHRGQLLGAPIGTGSDAQYVAADYILPRWLVGLSLERVRYDNDAYYRYLRYPYTKGGHDAELTTTVRGAAFLAGVQLTAEIGYSFRHNRGFVGLPGVINPTVERNLGIRLGAALVPGGGRSAP